MQKIFLLCLATGIIFASCEDNNELSETSDAVGVEMPERPIEDAMLVTTDFETKMYGMISEGFPSRLAARIKNPTPVYNDSTTRVCIVSDDAIKKNELTVDDYIDIYNCYEKGGIVIVTTPTVDGFNLKFQVEMALAAYYKYAIATNLQVDGKAPTPDQYMSREKCVETLVQIVSGGGNLLLNVGPTADGRIPAIMQDRLLAIGRWLKVNGEAIYATRRAKAKAVEKRVYVTAKGDALYAVDFRLDGKPFTVKGVGSVAKVALVGSDAPVAFAVRDDAVTITPPALAPTAAPCECAWVYRLSK